MPEIYNHALLADKKLATHMKDLLEEGKKWTPKIGQCYKVESGLTKRIPEDGQTT